MTTASAKVMVTVVVSPTPSEALPRVMAEARSGRVVSTAYLPEFEVLTPAFPVRSV